MPYRPPVPARRATATIKGMRIAQYDGPESLTLLNRCIYHEGASIPVTSRAYNNLKTIVQTDDFVVILVEWMHEARIVRLDSEHLPPEIRSLSGDSIGWWEDDTLVVDTTNFRRITEAGANDERAGHPSTRQVATRPNGTA